MSMFKSKLQKSTPRVLCYYLWDLALWKEHKIDSALMPLSLLGHEIKRMQTYFFGVVQILNSDMAPRCPEAMLDRRCT